MSGLGLSRFMPTSRSSLHLRQLESIVISTARYVGGADRCVAGECLTMILIHFGALLCVSTVLACAI